MLMVSVSISIFCFFPAFIIIPGSSLIAISLCTLDLVATAAQMMTAMMVMLVISLSLSIYIYLYIYVLIYLFISVSISLSVSISIYIYICMSIYIYIYVSMYMYNMHIILKDALAHPRLQKSTRLCETKLPAKIYGSLGPRKTQGASWLHRLAA